MTVVEAAADRISFDDLIAHGGGVIEGRRLAASAVVFRTRSSWSQVGDKDDEIEADAHD